MHPENVDGPFFVDTTCIDCGTCRWMAPQVFDAVGGGSRVHTQPTEELPALQALVACPTGSIGVRPRRPMRDAIRSFPRAVLPGVYHCGFHAESSFGAASWLLVRPEGNVLIDSPRFNRHLLDGFERLGGVAHLFLTHCDDVADHAKWAEALGCERWLHADDVRSGTRDVEHLFSGDVELAGLQVVETPGHTRGSCCLLAGDVLFTGDHIAGVRGRLRAFRGACWYSWDVLHGSVEKLRGLGFRHVLPGHGAPFSSEAMDDELDALLAWM